MSADALLSSSKRFLLESLDCFSRAKGEFAIVHAVTATELLLKAKLATINPALVNANIDAAPGERSQTVQMVKLPQRLQNLGVDIGDDNRKLVATFSEWRNQIVHHMRTFNEAQAAAQLPELVDFLVKFLREEFATNLEDFLPRRMFRLAQSVLDDWKRVVAAARERAADEGNVSPEHCPSCGSGGVLSVRLGHTVYCHLCNEAVYRYDWCAACGEWRPIEVNPYATDEPVCADCVSAAGDAFIDQLVDRQRGK